MKYARTIGLVLLMAAIVTSMGFASPKPSKSAIINSAHDLRAGFAQYGYNSYALCNYCHIAHKVAASTYPANIGPLLWNHTLSSVTAYGVYSSDIFNSYGTDIADLGPLNTGAYTTSNMCLSCHDGTVAIASFYDYGDQGLNGKTYLDGEGNQITTMPTDNTLRDLTNVHPVNFTYYGASWIPQAGVLAPASLTSVDGAGAVPLENGKLQCWTCHDAHNGASSIFEQNFPTQASGTFCTYCHL
ncbi:MAG: hypothetical protein WBX03_16255 [Terriglobales bacterium]|jgi:hypothetical protein